MAFPEIVSLGVTTVTGLNGLGVITVPPPLMVSKGVRTSTGVKGLGIITVPPPLMVNLGVRTVTGTNVCGNVSGAGKINSARTLAGILPAA